MKTTDVEKLNIPVVPVFDHQGEQTYSGKPQEGATPSD